MHMKKRIYLCGVSFFLLCIFGIMFAQQRNAWLLIEENAMSLTVKADNKPMVIEAWFSEEQEIFYFFCPSFMVEEKISIEYDGEGKILVNGETKREFKWDENTRYKIETEDQAYQVIFMKAQNLPALFLETNSGSMDYIHENKLNSEEGTLTVITQEGNVQYSGVLEEIAGRGNSTWHPYKKPYSIKLRNKRPLCGMEAGKEWKLLALYFEQDKINTKIVFEMANRLGLTETPDCRWVDLYCNGEYRGLYLLTEAVESDTSLQGGYLVEKGVAELMEGDEDWFITEKCQYCFSAKQPAVLSGKEREDISLFVQKIEDLLLDGDIRYREYIDMGSLARQFLIDKITMESDAMWTSTFFQIDLQNNILKAGPLWDYDRAMGELFTDYETPIEGAPNAMAEWYMRLYDDEQFFEELMAAYREIIPYVQALLYDQIDEYVNLISHSVAMDSVLMAEYSWVNETCSYGEYDSYVKYLKFFLASRMNYLSSVWGVEDIVFNVPPSSGEFHAVTFLDENGDIAAMNQILDGEIIKEFPETGYGGGTGGWYWWHGECGQQYDSKRPIYEDTVLSKLMEE